MRDIRRNTPDGQIGLLETPSGFCITTWTKSGRIEHSMATTRADAVALRDMLLEALPPSSVSEEKKT